MNSAKIILIIETKSTTGDGRSEGSPIRRITEYFTLCGEKIAQKDPGAITITVEGIAILKNDVAGKIAARLAQNGVAIEKAAAIVTEILELLPNPLVNQPKP